MKPKLFLSHSSEDKPRVRDIKSQLEQKGMDCWLDEENILVGHSIVDQIGQALESTDFVVFFISKKSINSNWVRKEVNVALANQLKAEQIRILPVKLDSIDPPQLLADLLWADLSDPTTTEGVDLLVRSIESHFENCPSSKSSVISMVQDDVLRLKNSGSVSPKFHWFIISGLSSAGKDVLAYVLDQRLNLKFGTEQGIKYTTRGRRPSEPNYVREVSRSNFEELCNKEEIIFRYTKRHESYGFDFSQLRDCATRGIPLISVYTHFNHVPKITNSMKNYGIKVTPIFIQVPRYDLSRRLLFRNLPGDDVAKRMRSIEQDLREIKTRPQFDQEYKFIYNGDDRAFTESIGELEEYIKNCLKK